MSNKVVGWFETNGQLVMIRAEEGQSPEEAIAEEAMDKGVDPNTVKRGPPPGYSTTGEKMGEATPNPNPNPAPTAAAKEPETPSNTPPAARPTPKESPKPPNRWAAAADKAMKDLHR